MCKLTVAGNREGQKWLTDSMNHMRRKHVQFGSVAHHDIMHVGTLDHVCLQSTRVFLFCVANCTFTLIWDLFQVTVPCGLSGGSVW